MKSILVACSSGWLSKDDFEPLKSKLLIEVITREEDLSLTNLSELNPSHVFFPHWSWKIPQEIIESYKPIIFHTAPLPHGRGGSPIQNLILSGYKKSPVWALFATEKFDEGPLITSRDISLEGNLSDIFIRLKAVVIEMILEICESSISSKEQEGEVQIFKRLTIADNLIPKDVDIGSVYDRIRMVDAPGYPNAYIYYGNLKIEFENAKFKDSNVITTAKITAIDPKHQN